MLTAEDKDDIRRIVAETVGSEVAHAASTERSLAEGIEEFERLVNVALQIREFFGNEFPHLKSVNPRTGHTRAFEAIQTEAIVEVTARAMEVFGNREKALRWLNNPVHSLGDRTPLSQLDTPEGIGQAQETLGRIEHGVW